MSWLSWPNGWERNTNRAASRKKPELNAIRAKREDEPVAGPAGRKPDELPGNIISPS